MNKQQIIEKLNIFRNRLLNEVCNAYKERGIPFGSDRFDTWTRTFRQFLKEHLPGEVWKLNMKLQFVFAILRKNESAYQEFWREKGETMVSYIDSLILDVENDEYERPNITGTPSNLKNEKIMNIDRNNIFIVHGRDGKAKEQTARFIEKLSLKAIVLHEQASGGRTIIEKIENYSNVGFAIVLYTPDDVGNIKMESDKKQLKPRARQNVVFEYGYLMGKIGRRNVVALVEKNVELPNDISGIVYITNENWQFSIAKEMKDVGYEIDLNKL